MTTIHRWMTVHANIFLILSLACMAAISLLFLPVPFWFRAYAWVLLLASFVLFYTWWFLKTNEWLAVP